MAVAEAGGTPVLWDINGSAAGKGAEKISDVFGVPALGVKVDITDKASVKNGLQATLKAFKRADILINNAANDPKVKKGNGKLNCRFEDVSLKSWNEDIAVGLTGAFICSQLVGSYMAGRKAGVILNIGSDLSIISPDQRLYRKSGLAENKQPVKPVSYSVIKHGIIGLTKYLATYWAEDNVRVNTLCPSGVYNGQPREFVQRLVKLIPMARMANADDYKAAVIFLCSQASAYMTGACLVIDGGRTIW